MNQTNISIANIDTNAAQAEAYDQGAEFAEKDWQWVRGDIHGPSSMAAHRERTWAFLIHEVCPEWAGHDEVRGAFFVGYEDRATELANAGEAGYETLAEAGTVADTDGWVLQSLPWPKRASEAERAARVLRAADVGAAVWRGRAKASGNKAGRYRAEEAEFAARTMAESILAANVLTVH
ncbi:hypothetical protein SB768_07500 [Burkholderia sp. SIMBA_043]|uniref:hypothetical protein n=1 Tax=Burkholderia TaxID=32008 RepID=UPI0005D9A885|nr:hypothetical protein [Burkholderia vietnamiensis]AJY06852.1 hypothetical protein AK36_2147 [Burkholderia vietnamiensis LMG 10929]AVR17303.1 hypothetical protein A8H33_29185 [Burkholderia vietnamiensis]KVM43112.1 hypothetical protein WJ57_28265 [Burkholderia vietnamiensis]KVS06417.1 hypothetical protein WK30_00940 [Burkholderia vietnamiensis]UBI27449.1 hypothetical protein LA325_14800 [Burkholderia vietnamiensis]